MPEIHLVRADGSDDRTLDKSGMLAKGAFSPDGTQLAMLRSRQADTPIGSENSIWVMPTTGGEPRQISPWYALTSTPAWADNQHLLYAADESFATNGQIYRIDVQTGAEPELLARGSLAALSPDRTKLLVGLEFSDDIAPDTRFAHVVIPLDEPSRTLATLQLRPGQYASEGRTASTRSQSAHETPFGGRTCSAAKAVSTATLSAAGQPARRRGCWWARRAGPLSPDRRVGAMPRPRSARLDG
ncbi:MAG TPA: hypothetical protein VFO07_20270 [Roseiflexaceae bacterium]|nr:hypothetical protein [Roseiflexaceae bacterium]